MSRYPGYQTPAPNVFDSEWENTALEAEKPIQSEKTKSTQSKPVPKAPSALDDF